VVGSSKSWLSYAAVDRTAAILPWGVTDPGGSNDSRPTRSVHAAELGVPHIDRWDRPAERVRLRESGAPSV
ncbi:MAG: hypothetical protein JW940_06280, partial [Polyangiaceae bacterium]|nr:hypothetical protein [Polyangiaceae bacterium]